MKTRTVRRWISRHLVGGMMMACSVFGIASVRADVYSNVYFWSRGLATDLNGDGVLNGSSEARDSLNATSFTYSGQNLSTIAYTNEWAHLPYRGTTNFVQSLYFPQKTEKPCLIEFNNPLSAITAPNGSSRYTVFLRFRPDWEQPSTTGTSFATFGYGIGTGFLFLFNDMKDTSAWENTSVSYRTAALSIRFGGKTVSPVGGTAWRVNLGNWNDLVVSVDGSQVRLFISRDGYTSDFGNSIKNVVCDYRRSSYAEVTIPDGIDVRPASGWKFILGAGGWNSAIGDSFRGSIQTVAFWTNALTKAQMQEAAAWPRMDKWRLGVEDGTAAEFKSAASGLTVDVDGDTWAVPSLGKDESFTVRFPLDASGDAKMNQFIRIKGAQNGVNALLKIAVNGIDCDSPKFVLPGRFSRWFIPSERLKPNATNTLVVTRLDSGATPFGMDVAAFGGSVQYGEENGSWNENGYEWNQYLDPADTCTYNLIGANWFDGGKAIRVANGENKYTNQMIRFYLPDDLRDLGLDYQLTVRTTENKKIKIVFNDRVLADEAVANGARGLVYPICANEIRATNDVNILNVDTALLQGIDFVRFNVQRPPTGLCVIIR